MPVPRMRRPAYFGCSTAPPRSTAISVAGSRMATSTAVSIASMRGLVLGVQVARIARRSDGSPCRGADSVIGPSSSLPSAASLRKLLGDVRARQQHRVAEMPAGLLHGRAHATGRCPDRSRTPSLSRWSSASSAATCSRVGVSPGHSVGRCVDELFDAHEAREVVRQAGIELADMRVEKSLARAARALMRRRLPPPPARRCAAALAAGAPRSSSESRQNSRIAAGDRSAKSVAHRRLGAAPAVDRRVDRRPPAAARHRVASDRSRCACCHCFGRRSTHALRLALRALDRSGRDHANLRRHTDIGLDQVLGARPAQLRVRVRAGDLGARLDQHVERIERAVAPHLQQVVRREPLLAAPAPPRSGSETR